MSNPNPTNLDLGELDPPLRRWVSRLRETIMTLGSQRLEADERQRLAEVVCIESRSAVLAYFDQTGWDCNMSSPEVATVLQSTLRQALAAIADTVYAERIRSRIEELDAYQKECADSERKPNGEKPAS